MSTIGRRGIALIEVVLEAIGWGICLFVSYIDSVLIAIVALGLASDPGWPALVLIAGVYNALAMLLILSLRRLLRRSADLRRSRVRWAIIKARFVIEIPLMLVLLPYALTPF